MKAETLIKTLTSAGVRLAVNGDRLKIDAPQGLLTPEMKEELAAHKLELIKLLTSLSPRIENGALVIPHNCDPKYRWWQGGQSVAETLAELSAPIELWRQHAPESDHILTPDHAAKCGGTVRQTDILSFCPECKYFSVKLSQKQSDARRKRVNTI